MDLGRAARSLVRRAECCGAIQHRVGREGSAMNIVRFPVERVDWQADLADREAAWECADASGARGAEAFGEWLREREEHSGPSLGAATGERLSGSYLAR